MRGMKDADWVVDMTSEELGVFECQYCNEKLGSVSNAFFVYLGKDGTFVWIVCPNCGHHYRKSMGG